MNDKRYLFRGFHPYVDSETIISYEGIPYRGVWVYWDVFGNLIPNDEYLFPKDLKISDVSVIPETIGQWVTTDKNGKDVFEGDIVKAVSYMDTILAGRVRYDNEAKAYEVYNYTFEQRLTFSTIKYVELDKSKCELDSNKWECEK